MRERRTAPVEVADTKTSPTDVVTEVDRASEDLIRARLLAARPDDAVLGEEAGSEAGSSGVRWVVDPIDGTVNFLYGLPQYAVSIAAESGRRGGRRASSSTPPPASSTPPASARGATRDGAPHRRTPDGPAGPAAGDHRLQLRRRPSGPARRRRSPGCCRVVRDIRRLGSSALDVCYVADGYADAYVEEGVHLWDHAAVRAHRPRGGRDHPADPGSLRSRGASWWPRRTGSTSCWPPYVRRVSSPDGRE